MLEQLKKRLSPRAGQKLRELINRNVSLYDLLTVLDFTAQHGAAAPTPKRWSAQQFCFWLQLSAADVFVYEELIDKKGA